MKVKVGDAVLLRMPDKVVNHKDKLVPWLGIVTKCAPSIMIEYVEADEEGVYSKAKFRPQKIKISDVLAKFQWTGTGKLPHSDRLFELGKCRKLNFDNHKYTISI